MNIRKATPADAAYLAESCVRIARFMRQGESDKYIDGFPDEPTPDLVDWARSHTHSEGMTAFIAEAPMPSELPEMKTVGHDFVMRPVESWCGIFSWR